MEIAEFALKASLAVIAGLFIGLEREFQGKYAGLKTHALVALGACIFIMMSLEFEGAEYADMTRVLSQVIIGIGFIGAGTIIKKGKDIEGLTTAATIWCSAAVGCLSGFGYFKELLVTTVIVIFINFVFGLIEAKIIKKEKNKKKK